MSKIEQLKKKLESIVTRREYDTMKAKRWYCRDSLHKWKNLLLGASLYSWLIECSSEHIQTMLNHQTTRRSMVIIRRVVDKIGMTRIKIRHLTMKLRERLQPPTTSWMSLMIISRQTLQRLIPGPFSSF